MQAQSEYISDMTMTMKTDDGWLMTMMMRAAFGSVVLPRVPHLQNATNEVLSSASFSLFHGRNEDL